MYAFLLILHLLICLALIGVVLIQSGKGGGLAGGAFGGSAQTVFGGRGATDVVTRATMILGGMFFVTSVTLALITSGQHGGTTKSLVQEAAKKAGATQPQGGPLNTGSNNPTTTAPATGARAPATGTAAPAPGTAPAPAPAAPAPAGGK